MDVSVLNLFSTVADTIADTLPSESVARIANVVCFSSGIVTSKKLGDCPMGVPPETIAGGLGTGVAAAKSVSFAIVQFVLRSQILCTSS
jgi:hypothetical protein